MVEQLQVDSKTAFSRLWDITVELRQKLETRFELHPEPSTKDLEEYSSYDGSIKGSFKTFSGQEIDWLVHTWLSSLEKTNFGTMRLTVWLGSHIKVPHLAFEFGTIPNIFFYMDYIPRTDLLTDLESLDRYYEPANQTFLNLQADPRLSPYISKSAYIRQFQSSVNLCYTCSATEENLQLVRTIAHEMLDRWLTWIDEAETVPFEARTALAERDLFVCRSSVERDPGNKIAVQMLGAELVKKLGRALWGGDRIRVQN